VKPARQALKKPEDCSQHLTTTRFRLIADKACPKGKPRVPAPFGWNGVCSIGGLNDYVPPPNVTGADGPGLKPNRSEEHLLENFQGTPLKPSDNLLAMSESVSVRPPAMVAPGDDLGDIYIFICIYMYIVYTYSTYIRIFYMYIVYTYRNIQCVVMYTVHTIYCILVYIHKTFDSCPIKSLCRTQGSKQIHYNLTKSSGKIQKKLIRQLLEAVVPQARRLATHRKCFWPFSPSLT